MRLLLLGGYGNFGARIARALAPEPGLELVVAGREGARADTLAAGLGATSLRVDTRATGLARLLRDGGFGLVIRTAGPFQSRPARAG